MATVVILSLALSGFVTNYNSSSDNFFHEESQTSNIYARNGTNSTNTGGSPTYNATLTQICWDISDDIEIIIEMTGLNETQWVLEWEISDVNGMVDANAPSLSVNSTGQVNHTWSYPASSLANGDRYEIMLNPADSGLGNIFLNSPFYYMIEIGCDYMSSDLSQWNISQIAGFTGSSSMGTHSSVVVDSTGQVHAVYNNQSASGLMYATYDTKWGWLEENVDGGVEPYFMSLAVDSQDNLHVAYATCLGLAQTGCNLRYGNDIPSLSSWNITQLPERYGDPNNAGYSISLVLDESDAPHIAFVDRSDCSNDNCSINYMTLNGTAWERLIVDDDRTVVPSDLQIHHGHNGTTSMTWFDDQVPGGPLVLSTLSGSQWSEQDLVLSETQSGDLVSFPFHDSAYDLNANLHLSHYNETSRDLEYTFIDNASTTTIVVDAMGDVGRENTILIDSLNNPHIVYHDTTNSALKVASLIDSAWIVSNVDNSSTFESSSAYLDSNNILHIIYYDSTNHHPMHAKKQLQNSIQPTSNWTLSPNQGPRTGGTEVTMTGNFEYLFGLSNYTPSENLTGSGNVESTSWSNTTLGFEMSMVSSTLDDDGHAHLSYYDLLNTNLVYATNKNGSWVNYIIDSDVSGNGLSSSIAIDSNGTVHISYIDGDQLFYVNLEISGTISSFGIDFGTAPTMRLPKLQVDSLNMPHIVYYDEANYELRYVTRANFATQWTDVLVHATEVHELEFQLDSGDTAQIVYTWGDDILVNHAKKAVGNWTLSGLPFGMNVEHLAFALGPNDDQHVIFRHDDTYDSRHLYSWNNSTWTSFGLTSEQDDAKYFDIQIDSLNRTHITYDGSDSSSSNAVGNVYRVIDPLNISNSYAVLESNCRLLELDANDNIHCFFLNASGWQHSINLIGTSNQLQIEVGDYGNVTGLVVSDSILTFTTPVGPILEEVVDITVWSKDGIGYVMNAAFTYLPSVIDGDADGIPDENDDCPNDAGNSTTDKVGCPDLDGDGYSDSGDLFPSNPGEWYDTDGDGAGDNSDAFPNDGNETSDSDGDGVGDNGDAFPNDATETSDSDGDGVGDNADVFPDDSEESVDSDDDGVGDNADVFPNNSNETADSDNDGLGDNEDEYPFINNFIDSDGDEVPDLFDDFINDPTQWSDYDGDGYGDYSEGNNSDAFINNASQWSDTDGDGYGDNWGNSTWNQTRLFIWPGQFVENAVLADHCPTEFGNSTADGYFGCIDMDGDGIADIYDDLIQDESEMENQSNATNETGSVDSDGDGVEDLFDLCPSTMTGGYVDIDGCILDEDGDGVDDLKDACPGTKPDVSVNINGCIVGNDEPQSFIESLSSGDRGAVLQTVGIGAVLIAVLGFLQTNMVAALLPDSVRWIRVFRAGTKLNKEEIRELEYLKSLVQTYYQDSEMLHDELYQLKSELTARYTNSEIKKVTREKLNTLISDLLAMEAEELDRIAHNDAFFGLGGALSTKERGEYLEQDALMRFDDNVVGVEQELDSTQTLSSHPSKEVKGQVNETDGHEYLEHPSGSDSWYYRNHSNGEWVRWDN
ncbi:hypothetical protein N9N11_00565 [Candidatus Poseidoniales archaeon]|nr:hypothetical protein [Candidatus Poseidoniales archaeon]